MRGEERKRSGGFTDDQISAFHMEWIKTGSIIDAAINAKLYPSDLGRFKVSTRIGTYVRKHPEIIEDHKKVMALFSAEDGEIMKAQDVLKYLTKIATNQSTEQIALVVPVGNYKSEVQMAAKDIPAAVRTKALEIMAKHYGLLEQSVDISGIPVIIHDDMPEDDKPEDKGNAGA